jgi:hypothetical protein
MKERCPQCGFVEFDPYSTGIDTIDGCEHAAYLLFTEIYTRHGIVEARRIFMKFGAEPTRTRLRLITNLALLDRYDMMKPRPNVERLAKQVAEQNKKLPREQQRGAGGTDWKNLDKHIRRMLDERDERRGWCDFPRGSPSPTAD